MPVPTIITDLSTTESVNFPQDSDITGSTVASLPRNLSAIIKKQFVRGSDISVIGNGLLTMPVENNYFFVTGTGFNITGFTDNYNGRIVTLKFSASLTLIHSSSFILPTGVNISTATNDMASFVNDSTGIWICISYDKAILSNPVFTGNPTAPTPVRGDKDTSLATTSFVKEHGVNYPSVALSYSANATLLVTDVGRWIDINANGITLTLPPIALVEDGGTYTFISRVNNTWTLKANAAEQIFNSSGNANQYTIKQGEYIQISKSGSNWFAIYNVYGPGAFTSSLIPLNGYQKLPSGLIIQWGYFAQNSSVANTFYTFSYPISFPTDILGIVATNTNSTASYTPGINIVAISTSQGQISWSAGFAQSAIRYMVVGY